MDARFEPSLSFRIGKADRNGLVGLVSKNLARLSEREALQLLRHPYLSAEVVERLLFARHLLAFRSVRKGLALLAATPRPAALACLRDLFWHDLMEIGRSGATPMPVRRAANQMILEKLPRLSIGERMTLARFADRDLLPTLLRDPEASVFATVLRNPRLLPDDVVAWITAGGAGARHLELAARDTRWTARRDVRIAIVSSRKTPRGAALGLLKSLSLAELRGVANDPTMDPLLAACAERLMSEPRV